MKKIGDRSAAEVCREVVLTPEARALLDDTVSPRDFLDRLAAQELFQDAVTLMASALPKREAVWWACMCVRAASAGEEQQPADGAALQAAEAWVYKPQEEQRRAALAAAEAAGFTSAESWAAMGAFWSTGSMAPPDAPVVPPADDLTARAVSGAVTLAAVRREPERAAERYRLFLAKAVDIAEGGTGRDARPMDAPGLHQAT